MMCLMCFHQITCAACGGHLGHVFKGEGYSTPSMSTPLYCVKTRLMQLSQPMSAIV